MRGWTFFLIGLVLPACTLDELPMRTGADGGGDVTLADGTNDMPAPVDSQVEAGTDAAPDAAPDVPTDTPMQMCTVSSLMCPRPAANAVAGCMYGRCQTNADCGSLGAPWGCATPNGMNSIVPGIGIPGGMCSRSCSFDSDCPCGGQCLFVHGPNAPDQFMCQPPCTSSSDCLAGWSCHMDTSDPPIHWCAPQCAGNADCPAGMQCDTVLGTCY